MSRLQELPMDMIVEILLRLPVKYLMQYKCVCKPWYSLISNPWFAKQNLHHLLRAKNCDSIRTLFVQKHATYYCNFFEPEDRVHIHGGGGVMDIYQVKIPLHFPWGYFEVLGRTHGVLLVVSRDDIILWNPCIKVEKILPKPISFEGFWENYGLGYDSLTDDYKIVKVPSAWSLANGLKLHPHVFSLRTNTWKLVLLSFLYKTCYLQQATHVNGHLFWLALKCFPNQKPLHGVILGFDLGDERFWEVAPPPSIEGQPFFKHSLGVLEGCLCLITSNTVRNRNAIQIWVMKELGVRNSWTKLMQIKNVYQRHSWKLISGSYDKNGKILACSRSKKLMLCDPAKNRHRMIPESSSRNWNAVAYEESLVSPVDLVGRGLNI